MATEARSHGARETGIRGGVRFPPAVAGFDCDEFLFRTDFHRSTVAIFVALFYWSEVQVDGLYFAPIPELWMARTLSALGLEVMKWQNRASQ